MPLFPCILATTLAAVTLSLPSARPAQAVITTTTKQPNIVLIFVDDMGYGNLSCFGNPDIETPNIDRLARQGMRFTQFYTNSPICSPSRVAVTTGQYPGRHQIHSFLTCMDFFPTFCSLAGIPLNGINPDGIDMSTAFMGTPMAERPQPIVWEYGRQDVRFLRPNGEKAAQLRSPNLAIRDGRWKLLVNEDGTELQLYDFSQAPTEQTNVRTNYPEVVARLSKHLTDWYSELPSFKASR
ncbi:MAG: sulfatase-like hydrolase/transferase [Planctomycetaceae bacterium]|nr:sulfatase-like hydrolase/transferase [Planctomycetaceae bacterium]